MATPTLKIVVVMFNQVKRVWLRDSYPMNLHPDPHHIYSKEEVCYIERGEDVYGIPHYEKSGKPFVCIERMDFLKGEIIYDNNPRFTS